MSKQRDQIEAHEITEIVATTLSKIKEKGKNCRWGGISTDAIPNIKYFISNNLIDKFETRKVVFSSSIKTDKINYGILNAVNLNISGYKARKDIMEI